ncbi:MAG: hypothetical protein JW969_20465 [Spirochaetales bacterium]|nr:hypothetical protein [Spirochaetales bacterium]
MNKILITIILCIIPFPAVQAESTSPNSVESQIARVSDRDINKKAAIPRLNIMISSADPEMRKGLAMIFFPELIKSTWSAGSTIASLSEWEENLAADGVAWQDNYSLTLLLYMLSGNTDIENDTIIPALALANNYIYSLADEETRKAIKKDLGDHIAFYKKVVKWQKESGYTYLLDACPVIAKIFWADRAYYSMYEILTAIQSDRKRKLSKKIYTEFVDRISVLEDLHLLIRTEGLADRSLTRTAAALESDATAKRVYRCSIEDLRIFHARGWTSDKDYAAAMKEYKSGGYEKKYMDKKRRWDEFRWLNYQYSLFKKEGYFKGDCGDTTVVQMGYFRAAGIAPVSLQRIGPSGGYYMHNFPGFYHPGLNRWFVIQKNFVSNDAEAEKIIYFHYIKPVWHHLVYELKYSSREEGRTQVISSNYYQGEKIEPERLSYFLSLGMEQAHLERLFFSDKTQVKGLFFTDKNAPKILTDTDGEGLPDILEVSCGTDPGSPDSDSDGISDAWEIEYGYDPNNAEQPGPDFKETAIDGLPFREAGMEGMQSVYDPKGDSKANKELYDIASLSGGIIGNALYLAVTFHNDTASNRLKIFSFSVVLKGKKEAQYWVQWVDDYSMVYHQPTGKNEEYIQAGNTGLSMARTGRAAEFIIPMALLDRGEVITAAFHACGYFEGKDQIVADSSDSIRIVMDPGSWSCRTNSLFAHAISVTDEKGDAKTSARETFDLSSFSMALNEGFLYCRAVYGNDISANTFGLHTIHIHDTVKKSNLWIQTWSAGTVAIHQWADGMKSTPYKADTVLFDSFRDENSFYCRIPLNWFKDFKNAEVTYHVGALITDSEWEYFVDSSEKTALVSSP